MGHWTRPKTTSVCTLRKKKCKSDHETWGPQKTYLQAYIIHYHGPMGFVLWEAKDVLLLQKSRDHGRKMLFTKK